MPCFDPVATDRQKRAYIAKEALAEIAGKSFDYDDPGYRALDMSEKDLDKDTKTLCDWRQAVGPARIATMSLEFQRWWLDHQIMDRNRRNYGTRR
jgi:hypothetical protein